MKTTMKNLFAIRMISVLLLILVAMLPLASCMAGDENKSAGTAAETGAAANEDVSGTSRQDLVQSLRNGLLPAEETAVGEAETLPGGLTEVRYLPQAPQDLVGKKLILALTKYPYSGETVFRYTAPQGDAAEELAIFVGSLDGEDDSRGGYFALTLKTDYGSTEKFLSESAGGTFTGTVTAVRYISFTDMLHSSNDIAALQRDEAAASADSVICYGSVAENGSVTAADGGTKDAPAADVFESTLERFGLS